MSGFVIDTAEGINFFHLLQMRTKLKIEVEAKARKSNLKFRGSVIKEAKQAGYLPDYVRTKELAYRYLDAWVEAIKTQKACQHLPKDIRYVGQAQDCYCEMYQCNSCGIGLEKTCCECMKCSCTN